MPLLFRAQSLFKQSLITSRHLGSSFIELESLNKLTNIVRPGSLVFFDLDNTLISPTQTIGSDQWFYWHMLKFNPAITLPLYHLAQMLTNVQLVEESADKVIKELRKSHSVFGLTSRGKELMCATERQLLSVGIKFDSVDSMLKHKTSYSDELVERVHEGVFYTGGGCKGNMLEKLHQHMNAATTASRKSLTPRYFQNQVVLVDDTQSKLDAFIVACDRLGIDGLAVRYTAMDHRLEINPDVVRVQEQKLRNESRLISDDEAHKALKMEDITRCFDSSTHRVR